MTSNINNATNNIILNYNKSEFWEIIAAILFAITGIIISCYYPYLAAALTVLGLWIFIKHNLGSSTIISRFFKNQQTETQIFQSEKTNESSKNRLLLVPEEFYSNTLSQSSKNAYKFFQFAYIFVTGATVFWLYSRDIMGSQILYYAGNGFLLLIQIIFLLTYLSFRKKMNSEVRETDFSSFVENFNDVENLHILQKPARGTISALRDFIENNTYNLTSQNTLVVNISKYIDDRISIVSGEGIIVFHAYENQLRSKANSMMLNEVENKVYRSDLMPFTMAHFQGISLEFGKDEKENIKNLAELLKL